MNTYEKAFAPVFLVATLALGIAFGFLLPLIFTFGPLVVFAVLAYMYSPVSEKHFGLVAAKKLFPPTVLIVEDDSDIATVTSLVFKKLGCRTLVSDGLDDISQKIKGQPVDLIVLDWLLKNNLHADQWVKAAVRIVDRFNDLKSRFTAQHPKIVTYSVLNRSEVELPSNQYFDHFDHWQKPVKYSDLEVRASALLTASGFA